MRHLDLLSASGPSESIVMDILDPLPRTTIVNQFEVIMNYQYSKLIQAVQSSKSSATHFSTICYEQGMVPYGIRVYFLTDNETQLVSSFFKSICNFLVLKHLMATDYHTQTNEQAERYNRTLIGRLCN